MRDLIICQLTGTEGPGVDAHIIPRGFYDLSREAGVTRIISSSPEIHPRRVPIGAYDSKILTAQGERIFSPWDRYAHELLIRDKDRLRSIEYRDEVVAFTAAAYDYAKLKLFFLSVLWRASVSTLPCFSRALLGPFEQPLREYLLIGDPGPPDLYSVFLAKYWDKPDGAGMIDPHRTRFFGVNYFYLSIGPYIAYVKVDKQRTPDLFEETVLAPSRPLIVYAREFATSNERAVMQKVAKLHAARRTQAKSS